MRERIRILIARLGLDAHWRGSIIVAKALRDAGMEVIYLGNKMPEAIVEVALQEDVDIIGLSSLSGNHNILAPQVIEILNQKGENTLPVILGGAIPQRDIPKLKEKGIVEIFGPGSSLKSIIDFILSKNSFD